MDRAYEDRFRVLTATTPCCRRLTSLNDLDYNWPQAFARVWNSAMNPGVSEPPPGLTAAVEERLGLPVRVIRRHI